MTSSARARVTQVLDTDARGPRLVALGLAGLYTALVPLHLLVLTGAVRTTMATTAALSAVLLLAVALLADRRPDLVPARRADLIGIVPLANCLLQLGVGHDLDQTSPLSLVLVALGAGISRTRTLVTLSAVACLTWVEIVRQLPADELDRLVHHAVGLLTAVVAMSLLFVLRRRREEQLVEARDGLSQSQGLAEQSRRDLAHEQRRFSQVFRDSPVGIGISDEHGHFVSANAALCRLFGRSEAELLGRSSLGFTHPEDRAAHGRAQTLIENAADGVVRIEKRYVRPDGDVRWAWLTVNRIDGPGGEPWTLAHLQDVTERKAVDQALADSEANLAAVGAVVRRIRTGADAREAITAAVLELSGAQTASIIEPFDADTLVVAAAAGGLGPGTQIPLATRSAAVEVYRSGRPLFVADAVTHPLVSPHLVARCGARSLHFQPVIADGTVTGVIAVSWSTPLPSLPPRIAQALELLADETAVALVHDQLLARLAALATTDSLTGLPNRRAWDDQLGQLLARARRTGEPLTVAMVDLDHFKAFNDTHGHVRGDALLATTARRFAAQLRDVDLLARWGGEEFALALPGCRTDVAAASLQRLRTQVSHGQTCSIGHATWDGTESAEQLLARADAALYDAKASGRDRTVAALVPAPREPEQAPIARPA